MIGSGIVTVCFPPCPPGWGTARVKTPSAPRHSSLRVRIWSGLKPGASRSEAGTYPARRSTFSMPARLIMYAIVDHGRYFSESPRV